MIEVFSNNAQSTLAAGISSSAVSCSLLSGSGSLFPNPSTGQFFRLCMNDALTGQVREIIYVTARSGDTCSGLLRGQEGTTAVAWLSGDFASDLPTAGAMANLAQEQQVQFNSLTYVADTGAANAYVIAPTPANFATPTPGAVLYFLAAHANTGASTIAVNGGATYPILGRALQPLQGGEISRFTAVTYDSVSASYVLLYSTGGILQVPNPAQPWHAVNLGTGDGRYAKLAGNASQSFASSVVQTPVVQAPAGGNLLLESDVYTASVNRADNAYVQHYVLAASSLQAAPNLGQTNTLYAYKAGSSGQSFAANVSEAVVFQAVTLSSPAYLSSNNYTASVNGPVSGYVQHYCANAVSGQAAVNLSQANALYAPITGSYSNNFKASSLYLNGWIYEENGGGLYSCANGGFVSVNLGNTAYTPVTCAGASNGQQATILGQFAQPQGGNAFGIYNNTTVTVTASFTTPKGGLLIGIGTCNYSNVASGGNTSTLYINGQQMTSDTTNLTRTHHAVLGLGGASGCSCQYVAAASLDFSAGATLVFIPFVG